MPPAINFQNVRVGEAFSRNSGAASSPSLTPITLVCAPRFWGACEQTSGPESAREARGRPSGVVRGRHGAVLVVIAAALCHRRRPVKRSEEPLLTAAEQRAA